MTSIGKLFISLALWCLVACKPAGEGAVLIVYHDGNQYEILERGDMVDSGVPAYFVRFRSEDPFDASVRGEERGDILAIVAKHIDTNKHHRVVLIAEEKKGPWFGLLTPRAHTESWLSEQVLEFAPDQSTSGR